MRKKIVGIFVCTLLVVSTIPMISSIEGNYNENNFEEYSPDEILIEDDCGCGRAYGYYNRLDRTIEKPMPVGSDENMKKPQVLENLPEYFNWMDYEGQDWTTSVKNQHSCGSCWDFAAIGALESIINIREGRADLDVDLSEQYVLSCLPRSGNCVGGLAFNAYFYIMSNGSSGNYRNGIIPESCFPYKSIDIHGYNGEDHDNDPVLCDEKCENWEDFLIPISDCGYWHSQGTPEDINAIKSQVMQHGPVVTSLTCTWYLDGEGNFIEWGLDNHDPEDYFSNPKKYSIITHSVIIVGWQDDPEITNGGYWICKNSWGEEFGYDGFFNIEYGTELIDGWTIEWVDYDPDVIVNWEPVANAGDIYYGDVGVELTFDGSSSFDHEGEIVSYLWDFGDGDYENEITTIHVYESMGVYPVTLTVVDNEGNEVNDSTWAFIGRSNDPPEAPTINCPSEGKIDVEYNINFSTTDPEGDDIYYYIYWGDNCKRKWHGPFPSGKEVKLKHTWTSKLSYTIRALAKDKFGFKSNWTSLEVAMPKNKAAEINFNFLSWLYECFPITFQLLKIIFRTILDLNTRKNLFDRS